MGTTPGVKSKEFGCFWKSMFMVALCYPDSFDPKNTLHVTKRKNFKIYYKSLGKVIPCKFCREFITGTLEKRYPLDFSGRYQLFRSLYLWKDAVNKKLIRQGNRSVKASPPLNTVITRYSKYLAHCDPIRGSCV